MQRTAPMQIALALKRVLLAVRLSQRHRREKSRARLRWRRDLTIDRATRVHLEIPSLAVVRQPLPSAAAIAWEGGNGVRRARRSIVRALSNTVEVVEAAAVVAAVVVDDRSLIGSTTMHQSKTIVLILGGALTLLPVVPVAAQVLTDLTEFIEGPPPSFSMPTAAVQELKRALKQGKIDELAALLGLSATKLRASDEAMSSHAAIRIGAERQLKLQDLHGRKIVLIGDRLWPLPFPLVEGEDGTWAFDTELGLEEIVNRRLGANELATIQTIHDYVKAQYEYAREDRDEDDIIEFAQRLISSAGTRDGLYWSSGDFDSESPAGAVVETAAFDRAKQGDGYYGYRYRILTGQGGNVVGDKQSYIVNGNMTGGFALIAWPANYRNTGLQTFVVNGAGIIYEADLGEHTEELALAIREFDPDASWNIVNE